MRNVVLDADAAAMAAIDVAAEAEAEATQTPREVCTAAPDLDARPRPRPTRPPATAGLGAIWPPLTSERSEIAAMTSNARPAGIRVVMIGDAGPRPPAPRAAGDLRRLVARHASGAADLSASSAVARTIALLRRSRT